MLRRSFLQSLAAAPLGALRTAPPNFLIIYTDDQGIGDLGCYGAADIKTPYLDRIAATGVRFTDWYTNSPVCSPSRASVLTGKYPQNAGIPQIVPSSPVRDVPGLRPGETTVAGELRRLGYSTAAIGKWHLGSAPHSRPLAQGFDEFFGFYSGWTDYYSHRFYTLGGNPVYHDLWRNETEVFEEPVYGTELLAREAKAFLSRQNRSQPFFLYLAFGAPDYPMMAPNKYLNRFPVDMDRDRRTHAAMIAAIDDAVGEILELLRRRGADDNTVIFIQSDNGATQEVRADHQARPYRGGSNGPYRGYKGSLWEGGIRMPALMRWPARIPAGRVVREIGMAMDIAPTFLGWAGAERRQFDGLDVSRMILDGAGSPHDFVCWDYDGQSAVRQGEWKYLINYRGGLGEVVQPGVWLSNLREDPAETRNYQANRPEIAQSLREKLQAWKRALAG